jgi:ABC-2 type transport system permease protein
LRSPEPSRPAFEPRCARDPPIGSLFFKELRQIFGGRAVWTLLLLACPLVGYSYFQAVSIYGEASAAAAQSPVLAVSLSPLDGVLVPTFGSFYVVVTLLFPFVAIRALGAEKESGSLRLLVQLPYRPAALVAVKLAAVLAVWFACAVPALSALPVWLLSGGHLAAAETSSLIFGHLLYGVLVGTIALFAASITESGATAAIVTLAFTIGSWVLDFTLAGRSGVLQRVANLSLTQVVRGFEQGLLTFDLVASVIIIATGFASLAAIWLPPGIAVRHKWTRSAVCVAIVAVAAAAASQIRATRDVSEDRRNSFSPADQAQLATMTAPLAIIVHLVPEDPRYMDLRRNVLAKLERAMPRVAIRLDTEQRNFAASVGDDAYGEIEYRYAGRSDKSRSTSPREILPLLYHLAELAPPKPIPGVDYPGYPHVADGAAALVWFLVGLPLLIVLAWWRSRHPPIISFTKEVIMGSDAKILPAIAMTTMMLVPAFGAGVKVDLAGETAGAEPKALIPVVGVWRIEDDGGKKVLAVDGRRWKEGQSSAGIADKARALYGERYAEFLDRVQAYAYFPYVVAKDVDDFRNGEIDVRFECLSGRIDQGAGILFNLKPNGDYLTVRANCLENNLVLWKFEHGRRSQVKWIRNTPTATREWHDLKVRIAGEKVEGYLDGRLYLEHALSEPVSGRIGLWSKADSYMHFDQFAAIPSE